MSGKCFRKQLLLFLALTCVGCGKSVPSGIEVAPVPQSEKTVPILIENLKSTDADGRLFNANLLGEMGPDASDAVPALEELTDDPDPRVQNAAKDAIEKIRGN